MKKVLKMIVQCIAVFITIPLIYLIISLLLTIIPLAQEKTTLSKVHTIYLTTNGVHADLVLPKKLIDTAVLKGQVIRPQDEYFAFGWGEENFYINTPTWGDLKFSVAFRAAFLKSKTLVHVTRYKQISTHWIPVKVSEEQLKKLNGYVAQTFDETSGEKVLVNGATYTPNQDNFYRAKGNYMFYRTCNSWLNKGLKKSGMKGSLWTPFDFGVLRWYD